MDAPKQQPTQDPPRLTAWCTERCHMVDAERVRLCPVCSAKLCPECYGLHECGGVNY